MAQHDYDIANANGQNFRADLNNVLDAVQSTNSGTSEPSTTVAYMLWADTTNNLLKVRNGANNAWISLGSINATNLGLAAVASPTFTGTVTAPELDLTGTTSLKLPVGTTAQRPTGATGDLRFNSTLSQVETYSGSTWEKVGGVPAGAITNYASSTIPSGWLECNGATISRSTYATLYSAIGTTFGAGDGSSTFSIPDLRGEFVRGWDNSKGTDSGRAFGSAQGSQMQQHNHSVGISDPGHSHNLLYSSGAFGGSSGAVTPRDSGTITDRIGSATTGISITQSNAGGTDNSSENRPRSIALVYIIKF